MHTSCERILLLCSDKKTMKKQEKNSAGNDGKDEKEKGSILRLTPYLLTH
jgi:hypothetical protein